MHEQMNDDHHSRPHVLLSLPHTGKLLSCYAFMHEPMNDVQWTGKPDDLIGQGWQLEQG